MPNWTPEQQKAMYETGSNILVAAAAGSGKTAVLVERIINKIINDKIDIDRLLVVTFTNAAAAEMRERILNALYKKIDEIESEEEQDNLRKQITLLNKASICTIDSFCLDIIHNNFYEIDISPNFRIADTPEMELLKQEVLEEIFEEKYETEDKNFEKLIKTYTSYRDDTPLKELILKIYTYIESSPFPEEWLSKQIEKFNIRDQQTDFAKTIWGQILLEDVKEEVIDDIKTLKAEELRLSVDKELDKFSQVYRADITSLETLLVNLDSWDKAYTLANSIDFIKWPISKILSQEKENAKKIRDNVKKKLKKKIEKVFVSDSQEANEDIFEMYQILVKLKDLILEFDKRFLKKKKEKNIVDFSDIEHFALQILSKEEVAKKYREKYKEIAIDEYQDSNLVQEYILTSISNGNNIYMVGDVKQSIYKFRQAVPDLFLKKYKHYGLEKVNEYENKNENGMKIKLFKNFRSRLNVLDFTNIIFENIMSERLGEIDYTEEEFLNLGASFENKEGQELRTEIDIIDLKKEEEIEVKSEDEETSEENELVEDIELEAKFVTKKIKELIKSKFQIYDNKKGIFRDIRYKDIVILLRSTKLKAPVFEKELINQNVPVFSDSSQEYLATYEIQTIMSLLKIIDNPMQDIPLVMVLKSPIYEFTDDELLEIRLTDKYSDFYTTLIGSKLSVSDELREKIDRFLNQIDSWRKKNEYLSLDELIWNIYEESNLFKLCGELPNGSLRQANLKVLFERAKQYETASFKGLFNFINFIEKIHLGSGDLSAAKLIGENEDVVRIMSIHKSKGLEFPIVFLSSSNTNFNMMDLNKDVLLHQDLGIGVKYIDYDMQIEYDTLTKQALKNKINDEILSEEMRILYVALTRAKEKLYITGLSKDYNEANEKMQEMVDIYNKQEDKINPILIKKYKNYLDWILLVNKYNEERAKELLTLNIFKKEEIINNLKIEDSDEEIKVQDVEQEEEIFDVNYKYKNSIEIPTKTSVTAIVSEHKEKISITNNNEVEIDNSEELDMEENEMKFDIPKFLKEDEEKITSAKKGTLVHLCMKNLDANKEYSVETIKEMIEDLKVRKIITDREAESINPYKIYEFTKSGIWNELKTAKEIHKEEPFYINIPASSIYGNEVDENILVQGIIDLYYIDKDDNLVLLDYKTDYVQIGEESKLIEKHKKQLMLYKEALENALQRKVDKVYIYSVYMGKEISI